MGPLRRCAAPLVLLLVAACGSPDAGPDSTLSAAGGPAGAEPAPTVASPTSSTTVVPVTAAPTTTLRAPATTAAPTTAPARPRPPTTPAPTTTAVARRVQAADPATLLAETTSVTQGGTTVFVKAVREQYLGEKVYVSVEATSAERISSIQIDFGDGYVTTNPQAIPWTLMTTGAMSAATQRTHTYPAPGRYRITVTLTVGPGLATASIPPSSPTELQWFPSGPEHAVTVTADFLQRPDPAPFTFPRLPEVTSE